MAQEYVRDRILKKLLRDPGAVPVTSLGDNRQIGLQPQQSPSQGEKRPLGEERDKPPTVGARPEGERLQRKGRKLHTLPPQLLLTRMVELFGEGNRRYTVASAFKKNCSFAPQLFTSTPGFRNGGEEEDVHRSKAPKVFLFPDRERDSEHEREEKRPAKRGFLIKKMG